MSGFDYSKWDIIVCSSDEDDEEECGPRVTRLEEGAQVNISPSGASITHNNNNKMINKNDESNNNNNKKNNNNKNINKNIKNDGEDNNKMMMMMNNDEDNKMVINENDESNNNNNNNDKNINKNKEMTDKDNVNDIDHIYKSSHSPHDGGFPVTYKWRQTRQEVFLSVAVSSSLKTSSIKVNYTKSSNILTVTTNGIEIISGELKYKIDYDDEDGVDWEIMTTPQSLQLVDIDKTDNSQQRVIQLIFQKHIYTPGSVIWWSSVFVNDDPIDVTTIPERLRCQKKAKVSENDQSTTSCNVTTSDNFADTWKKAHDMFIEKVKRKDKVNVDQFDDDDEDGF